jgi:hypothetical protein
MGIRLACLRHAASVHPEPGSNSRKVFNLVYFAKDCFQLLSCECQDLTQRVISFWLKTLEKFFDRFTLPVEDLHLRYRDPVNRLSPINKWKNFILNRRLLAPKFTRPASLKIMYEHRRCVAFKDEDFI